MLRSVVRSGRTAGKAGEVAKRVCEREGMDWDARIERYHKRYVTDKEWKEMSEEVQTQGETADVKEY